MICREYCDHEITVPFVMEAARAQAVKAGLAPNEVVDFAHFFAEQYNPFGDDLRSRLHTILPDKYFTKDAQVVYFPGCVSIYNFPEIIKDTFRIFEAAGIDYISCFDSPIQCCGFPVSTLGLEEESKKVMASVAKELSNAKVVISSCPTCAYLLKSKYPELGFKLTSKIYHFTEFAWPLLEEGKIKPTNLMKKTVMYHDPCYLGRYLDVYEQPRKILTEICREPIAEFSWNKKSSYCCGGGGGLPTSFATIARDITQKRLEEFYEGEPKLLVSACPSCLRSFQKVDDKIELLDIASVLARSLK